MKDGLKTTFAFLTKVNNEAAVDVLLPALDSLHQAIQEEALRALLLRRSVSGHRELLRRWPHLDHRAREILAERPARLSGVLREAVLSGDEEMCRRACEAISCLRDYDQMSVLLTAAEDENNPQADLAARTVLQLAETLYAELSQARDQRSRRNPLLVRSHIVSRLEQSVRRFAVHKRSEIMEAFLLLVNRENVTLNSVLGNPRHQAYLPLLELLTHSTQAGVFRLLLSFLDDYNTLHTALNVIAHRDDEAFLRQLLKKVGYEPSAAMKACLRKIERFAWVCGGQPQLQSWNDSQQHSLVQMLIKSGMKRLEIFTALEYFIRQGCPGGRRAAVAALAEFRGTEANDLCLAALEDPDPQVQAAAVVQLRDRGIRGAMQRLMAFIASPYEVVRSAARSCLDELNASRFLASFDMLEEAGRGSIARLIGQIDPQAPALLTAEMKSKSRIRRLRAVEAALEMGLVPRVQGAIISLLQDSDHIVRVKAAAALDGCDTPPVHAALKQALHDRSPAVQQEAENSLLTLSRQQPDAGPKSIDFGAVDHAQHLDQLRRVRGVHLEKESR